MSFFSCQTAKENGCRKNVTIFRWVISDLNSRQWYVQTELPEWTSVHLAIPAKQVASLPSISYSGYCTCSNKLLKQSTIFSCTYSYTRFCVHTFIVSLWWINLAKDQILKSFFLFLYNMTSILINCHDIWVGRKRIRCIYIFRPVHRSIVYLYTQSVLVRNAAKSH